MSYFAKIENDVVTQVIVADNKEWCEETFGGIWIETFTNGDFRKNYAGIGYLYNTELDVFIPPKLYNSWLLNKETCEWEAPAPMPTDDKVYRWDEDSTSWVEAPKE